MYFGLDEKKTPRIVGMKNWPEPAPVATPHPDDESTDPDDKKYKKKASEKLPTIYALYIMLFCFSVFGLVLYMDSRLPEPLTVRHTAALKSGRFIEQRARDYLKKLISVGARPAGSYENEVLAVDFLKRTLQAIADRAKPIHKMSVDLQKPRGSFNLQFVDGMTHHYRDIQNVVVKLESSEKSGNHALLVNCHFDSVPQSPGASDDAVSCAIMLEIIDILVQSDTPLRHNLIFLFNGAEENMLPASHGFITQHEWASEVRAFINLEACGAGGRELVFQSGPSHPWMIQAYGKVAPHPFASVIGQEIFQSGVIPGDTDFRIFRDYGGIPGLDLAYVKNGYVYHTKFDTESAIPPGSIQRAGDNVLAMVQHLSQDDALAHTDTADQEGDTVFFDVLGLFLVYYPDWVGTVMNLAVVALSLAVTTHKIKTSHRVGVTQKVYISQMSRTFCAQLLGLFASFVTVTIIATLLDAFGRPMSWYAKPVLVFFLFMVPTVFSVIAVFYFTLPRQRKFFQFSGGIWVVESLYFEVSKLVWTLFLLLMTVTGIKSSFFCTMWVLFPQLGRLLLEHLYNSNNPGEKKTRGGTWLAIHLLSMLPPLLFHMMLIYTSFTMFIPIMGRSGSAINPDLLIGYKAVGFTLATMSYICPLVMVLNRPDRIITCLYMSTFITMLLVILTRVGNPYNVSPGNIAPHRSLIIHTAREFYKKNGELEASDSGYFVVNLDRNSPKALFHHVPEFYGIQEISPEQCERQLFCGMPLYYPVQTMLSINHWIPATKPRIFTDTSLELIHKQPVEGKQYTHRLLFRVSGPTHMGVFLSPSRGVKLTNWSFEEAGKDPLTGPEWKDGRPTFYIFYSHGLSPQPWEFWVELKTPKTAMSTDGMLDLAMVGHALHGHEMKSPDFKAFLAQFPVWSYPVGWTSSYKAYKF